MKKLIFFAFVLLLWSCEMQPFEELAVESEIVEQIQGPYQVTPVSKNIILSLGKKLEKRIGFNVIEPAQLRQISDFTFDLEASQLTIDTLKRRTYSVPFLEKGDNFSTFNLVMVADSTDNVLEQYVLQYEFDSLQFQAFQETNDLILSGVSLKRYPFSSFFNDSNPGFLERCQGIFDNNGDPIPCETISDLSNATPIGGGGGGTSGSPTFTIGYGGGGSISCLMVLTQVECSSPYHNNSSGCTHNTSPSYVFTWECNNSASQRSQTSSSHMECQSCDISDFGSPTFTQTRVATLIDNKFTELPLSEWHLAYLSSQQNENFALEFNLFFQSQPNLNQNVAFIILTAQMEGALNGQMTQNFGLAIDHLVDANLVDPIILNYYSIYVSTKIAYLKYGNPTRYRNADGTWNKYLLLYDAHIEATHWALDIIGLAPVLGEPADLLNGALYVIEGDGVNATLSLVSSLPFLGYITSGPKIGFKVIQSATNLQSKQVIRWILDRDGFITFGDRSQLRSMLPNILATQQAHHIIPWSNVIQRNLVVQKAAKSQDAFHLNEALNGIPIESIRNQPNHEIYNNRIKALLDEYNNKYPSASPDEAYDFLTGLISRIRTSIINNPNSHLDQIIFR